MLTNRRQGSLLGNLAAFPSREDEMIPKILHQIWLGPECRPKRCMATWKSQHPTWEYRLWTEENLPRDLWCMPLLEQVSEVVGKVDLLRYELLYRHGGIYVDADSISLRPLDELCGERLFAAWEHEQARPGLIAQGVLGAERGHWLLWDLLKTARPGRPAWLHLGPGHFTNRAVLCPEIRIFPSYYFWPIHHSETHLLDQIGGDLSLKAVSSFSPEVQNRVKLAYAFQFWGNTRGWYRKLRTGDTGTEVFQPDSFDGA